MSRYDKKAIDLIMKHLYEFSVKKALGLKEQIKLTSLVTNKNFPILADKDKSKSSFQLRPSSGKSEKSDTTAKEKKYDSTVKTYKYDTTAKEIKYGTAGKAPKEEKPKQKYYIYGIDFVKLFKDIKENVTPKEPEPKWKTRPPRITIDAINFKTRHFLSSLRSAENNAVRLKRIEEFLNHVIQHPESKAFAIKNGAVNALLEARVKTADPSTRAALRMALAALGYADPPRSSGVRILAIDGGGMRGIAVIRMLEKIEEITGRKIYDLFDFICGVSTGAIITCALVPPNKLPMTRIYDLYRELSSKVFKQSAFWGTGQLFWSHAYYDTNLLEKFLKDYVGCLNLLETNKESSCPKIAMISTIVNQSKVAPFLFRNYGNPPQRSSEYLGSFQHTMFEAVRASAAAPTVFEEFKTKDMLLQDGGIVVNNPAAIALHEARCLWPNEKINCLVSIGTGKHDPVTTMEELEESAKYSSSWKQTFDKILESATDTEGVHRILNDLMPENTYYRLNPHLSREVTMDETNEEKLKGLEGDTEMYCRRNEDKFYELGENLVRRRSVTRILRDAVVLQTRLNGLIV